MMRVFSRALSTASLAVVAVATMSAGAAAHAQTAQDDDPSVVTANDGQATADEVAAPLETGEGDNVITITGSRIARPEFSYPNPIQSFTSEALSQSGDTNITDFLVDSPALAGSTTNQDVAGSNLANSQFTGLNLLDLRNLGETRTLVLVNGRRHVAAYPGIAAIDVNTIPVDLIERIDVLTGGVSAVYGADGVSGVVNFVLKRDFEGLAARAQAGISERGDAGNRFVSLTGGTNFAGGRGNVALSYEFAESDRFSQTSRLGYGLTGPRYALVQNPNDLADDPSVPDRILFSDLRWADSSPGGAVDLDLDGIPDFTGEGTVYNRGRVLPRTAYTIGGDSTARESYYGDFTPHSRRHVVNALGSFEISRALRLFAEGKYVRSRAETFAQPTFDFATYLQPDNAYLIERFGPVLAANGAEVNRDNLDFGIRGSAADRETLRGVLGAEGRLSDNLRYELTYVFGQSSTTASDTNDRIADRYFAALDAVVNPANGQVTCRINLPGQTIIDPVNYGGPAVTFAPGECVPLNILGSGSPSQAALNWIQADTQNFSRIRQHVVSGALSGDTGGFFNLPGGPVGFAVGAEYRKESSDFRPSEYSRNGQLLDSAPSAAEFGSFDVREVFGELNIPVLAHVPFAETLAFGGAVRFSDYSTVGSTLTWNLNGVYAPVRDISFRATYSNSVRAPNISELFGPETGTYEFIDDPCAPENLAEGTQYRAANCQTVLSQLGINPATYDPSNDPASPLNVSLLGRTGGNPNLSEETAKTWTAGVVLRPRWIRGLTLSLDWYDIKLRNAIATAAAQDVVDLCVDQPDLNNVFCSSIARNPATGYISDFLTGPQNVAQFRTAGLDANLNYRFQPFDNAGTFNFRLIGNYLDRLEYIPTIGADVDNDRDEPAAPKFSLTADLTWTKGPLTLNYGISWFSKTRRYTEEQVRANPDIAAPEYLWYKERWEHDFQAAYQFDNGLNLYAGVNNLFGQKPDVGTIGYPVSAVGRYFYVGARVTLDRLFRRGN